MSGRSKETITRFIFLSADAIIITYCRHTDDTYLDLQGGPTTSKSYLIISRHKLTMQLIWFDRIWDDRYRFALNSLAALAGAV